MFLEFGSGFDRGCEMGYAHLGFDHLRASEREMACKRREEMNFCRFRVYSYAYSAISEFSFNLTQTMAGGLCEDHLP